MDKNCVRRLLIALAVLPAQPAAAESGVTKDRIVLGQSVALTGPASQLGIQMRNGVSAYLDYVNAQGGVHGRKIELITLDDGYEPARTVPNTKKLIDEHKVFALIGYVGTPTSVRSEEHTSELQSLTNLVCRLLLEKKKNTQEKTHQPE